MPSRFRPHPRSRGRLSRPVPSPRPDVIVPLVRVHVISDMEGVAGIVRWQQTTGGEKAYDEGRVLYTEEINAAVRGARAAGATEVVVMDCHGAGGGYDFNSLVPDLLEPACEYVVQQEWTEYTAFLESGCDAAIEFTTPDRLQEFANRKGVEVTGARSLVARGDDWWAAWSGFFF